MADIRPRLPDPKRYAGDSKTLDTWLYSLKVYFNAIGWEHDGDDSEKCGQYVVALLEGAALQWHHRQSLVHAAPTDFLQLEHALKQQFGILDVERRARNTLRSLMQKGSVSEYVKQFEQIVMHLPTATQDELLHAFTYGLKAHIRSHVLLHNPATVNDAQTMALTVDDRQESQAGFRPVNNAQFRSNNNNTNSGRGYNSDVVPMEIGNMQRQGNKGKGRYRNNYNQQQPQQRTSNSNNYNRNSNQNKGKSSTRSTSGPCWNCGGGHMARNCKKQPSRRYNQLEQQFNKLQLAEDDGPKSSGHPHWETAQSQQNLSHRGPSS